MTRALSVCVDRLFADLDLNERVAATAAAGAWGIELWEWRPHHLPALGEALRRDGVGLATIGVASSHRLGDADASDRFVADVVETVEMVQELSPAFVVVISGEAVADRDKQEQLTVAADSLRRAATAIAGSGCGVLLEPLNRRDDPDWLVAGAARGAQVVRAAGHDDVRLLFDVYHSAMSGEDPAAAFAAVAPLVGHVHVADAPGAVEPGLGAIDWTAALAALEAADYRGGVGLEFRAPGASAETAAAIRRFERRLNRQGGKQQ